MGPVYVSSVMRQGAGALCPPPQKKCLCNNSGIKYLGEIGANFGPNLDKFRARNLLSKYFVGSVNC